MKKRELSSWQWMGKRRASTVCGEEIKIPPGQNVSMKKTMSLPIHFDARNALLLFFSRMDFRILLWQSQKEYISAPSRAYGRNVRLEWYAPLRRCKCGQRDVGGVGERGIRVSAKNLSSIGGSPGRHTISRCYRNGFAFLINAIWRYPFEHDDDCNMIKILCFLAIAASYSLERGDPSKFI